MPIPNRLWNTRGPLCRHEYLGPDPRVVGYWVDAEGDYHVKFYDTFLGDQWTDDRKWKFDVRMDEDGKWVDVDD